MTLTQKLTALVTDLNVVVEAANEADKAYNAEVGTPDFYKSFGADNVAAVQNNAVALRAVVNASLAISVTRGNTSDETRLQVIRDIANWKLTDTEALVARLYANATWWARNLSRDLQRATRPVCMDFASLPQNEVAKDDALLKAVAKLLLAKLS